MNPETDMPEMVSVMTKFERMRKTFHDLAQESYPGVLYPEMCWLFDIVLDVDATLIVQEPISKKAYVTFVKNESGNRETVILPSGLVKYRKVKRKFTPRQQELVREWWPLLPDEMKID